MIYLFISESFPSTPFCNRALLVCLQCKVTCPHRINQKCIEIKWELKTIANLIDFNVDPGGTNINIQL